MSQKQLTWILVLAVVGTIVFGTMLLLALGVLHPTVSLLLPRQANPPGAMDVTIVTTPSPSPSPSPTPEPTPPAYPQNAVILYVNGSPLWALSNRDSAEQLLSDYLSVCAHENLSDGERLIRAYIDATLEIGPVVGTVDYLTYEEAKSRLLANRSILPVVRTTERVTFETGTVETTVGTQAALPVGARLYRLLGKAERRIALSEVLYQNGIAVSESQTLASTRVGSDPSAQVIEEGAYVYPNEGATGSEGPIGKDAGELKFAAPCRGTIQSYFGMRYGTMHYGVDYALRPGGAITAPESGTVVFCGERGEYGFVIEIAHGNGFVSRLTHCASPSVEIGQHVYRGDQIALLALEENEPEPHLHYELLIDNVPYNPLQYIQ